MTLSVIISSYRGNEPSTRICIESLNSQTLPPSEIIVILDTREEQDHFTHSLSGCSKIPLIIDFSGKRGLAAARNTGIALSRGEIVAFIDDDAYAHPLWISEILHSFEDPSTGIVGGPVLPCFDAGGTEEKFYWIIGCTSSDPPPRRPIGCNMAFRRGIFDRIGRFDEGLGRIRQKLAVGEETELFLRAERALPEYTILFNPNAPVFHKIPSRRLTLRYFMKRAYEEGSSKARIQTKYPLAEEGRYLRYYLRHLDARSVLVLCCTGAGYLSGLVRLLREELPAPERSDS